VPPAPTARLLKAAETLEKLEKQRASLAARLDEARQARQAGTGKSKNPELTKLNDRVRHAAAELQRLRVDRAAQLGRLERAERQLESCQRSLQALSLDDAATPSAGAPQPVRAPLAAAAAAAAAASAQATASASRITPEETAAQKRVADLTDAHKRATNAKDAAVKAFEDARRSVETVKAAAEAVFDPDAYTVRADQLATAGLGNYLRSLSLPPVGEPPRRGQPDPRFDAYVDHFTELDDSGARRLKPAFQEPREAFAAFSAMHGAMQANSYVQSLLNRLLPDDITAISVSLRNGGEGLEAVVRPMVIATFGFEMRMSLGLVESADRTRNAMLPRRNQLESGSTITTTEIRAVAERNRVLLQLQEMPMHRAAIVDGAVHQICSILRGTVLPSHARAQAEVAAATQRMDQARAGQREPLRQWIDAGRALEAARGELRTLVGERRQREAEAAKAAAPTPKGPSAAAIPQTEIASSSGDAEARRLKLRGDEQVHTEAKESAQAVLTQLDADIRQAELDLRRAEDQFETSEAEHARGRAGARRQHAAQRQEIGQLRNQLNETDAQLRQALAEFDSHPARQALMSDRAWERAVERHVEPDDAAMRARARQTGYTGAYPSRAEMARAVTDIHARISEQPEFQAVLAARSRAEFERAAAAVPGGVTDLVHDHGREVGRGFSNDLDQTQRATSLTQSNFSLQFVQGRVVISHLYPHVPHRTFITAS
jgi:hypothetical protein